MDIFEIIRTCINVSFFVFLIPMICFLALKHTDTFLNNIIRLFSINKNILFNAIKYILIGTIVMLSVDIIHWKIFLRDFKIIEYSMWQIIFSFIMQCIVGPITEEIIYRGFYYSVVLKQIIKKRSISTIIVSIIFALMHTDLNDMILAFFISIYFIYILEKTKTLIIPMILHGIVNTIALIMTLYIIM